MRKFSALFLLVGYHLFTALLTLLVVMVVGLAGMEMARGVPFVEAANRAVTDLIAYLPRMLQGDLGMGEAVSSSINPQPVADYVGRLLGRSLGLLFIALFFSALVGIGLGIRAARLRRDNRSLLLILVSILGVSMPSFFAAMLLQYLLILWTRTQGSRLLPVGGFGWDEHLILPVLVLAARPVAQIARMTYVTMGQVLEEDYVRTAQAKGIRRDRIMRQHVYRNVAIPILTTIGLSLRFSLSSLPVVEFFFGWNGAGEVLLRAISIQDRNTLLPLLLGFSALILLINLLLDLLYRLVDPRLRDENRVADTLQTRSVRGLFGELANIVVAILKSIGGQIRSLGTTVGQLFERNQGKQDTASGKSPNTSLNAPSNSSLETKPDTAPDVPLAYIWRTGFANNLPLVVGTLLILSLIVIYLFGPQLSPHSPYTRRGIEYEVGKLTMPPFAPGEEYPWGTDVLGRDMMSLVLAGAQQTLSLAGLVVAARLGIGLLLGMLAGWFSGRWLDRLIVSVAEILATFPTLLLAMLFVLSLGIRGGFRPFLIALSLVGWSEMMQFVRSEVITARPKPFVESALSVGAGTPRVLLRHLLPNLLPAFISLAALEMGAVLMLLGELGYVGIFIGGGSFSELQVGAGLFQYSDVPEWGALLSNVRLYVRTYPWTAIYPGVAFFSAILAFNLFGEGLRQLVEGTGVRVMRSFNRYAVVAILLLVLATGWLRNNSGAVAFYQDQARQFDGAKAMHHIEALLEPQFENRAIGTQGLNRTAEYIAEQFATMGIQRGGKDLTWFQPVTREFEQLRARPELTIQEEDGATDPLHYGQDYREFAGVFRTNGTGIGSVHFLSAGELTGERRGFGSQLPRVLRPYDFSQSVLLVLSPEEALRFSRLAYQGVLIIGDEPADVSQARTLPALDPVRASFGGVERGQEAPLLWITEEVANRLLSSTGQTAGQTVNQLRRAADALQTDQLLTFDSGAKVEMTIDGEVRSEVDAVHVIGHLPAAEGPNLGGQLILVMTPYDQPPPVPGAEPSPAANHKLSGLALMLEVIRTMQESGYQPYRTFLFIAYSGEGSEQGEPASPPDVEQFLRARSGFVNNFEIEAVVELQGVGGGQGSRLALDGSDSLRLQNLFAHSARRLRVGSVMADSPASVGEVFIPGWNRTTTDYPALRVYWEGWELESGTVTDTIDLVDQEALTKAGQAVTLALMTMGREINY
ncbi:MAG: ABC transporter permease subunit [Chloroflexota bacterium]